MYIGIIGFYWGYIGIMEKKMESTIMGYIGFRVSETYKPCSKLLVSPLISPTTVLRITPYIAPFKEFRLWLMGLRRGQMKVRPMIVQGSAG